ncbi:MAG: arginine deiminase-related protein [Stellaceae bacterium]|jgi:N-dimethylarginine dimethylaminohydrolase
MKTAARDDGARFLMCAPDYFAVTYAINPWMDPAQWASHARGFGQTARREWKKLRQMLERLGARIDLVPPEAELHDLVFTANSAVVMDGVALLAHFRHVERQREEAHSERCFRALMARGVIAAVRRMPEGLVQEGAGDCVWDRARQMFWMGYGPRSHRDAARVMRETFGLETQPLELADPRFYHMDTALSPLPRGEMMYVPAAFTAEGLRQIRDRVAPEQRIELGAKDATAFAANAVCVDDDIVLSGCSAGLRRRLEAAGYRVHATPLGAFHRSGGSAFCLTLRLDLRSAGKGAARQPATGKI